MAQARSIHVVAGLILKGNEVCLSRRHVDAHQGGKWEFPGGKLNSAESPYAGLVRELQEELGIEVEVARPFMQVSHSYSELEVMLDIWQIDRYSGQPHGRENQEVRWFSIDALQADEFPAADRPILRRLQLPQLYLISDALRLGQVEFLVRLERALAAGVRLVQLREPHMDARSFAAYARQVARLCRSYHAHLLVNTDPDQVSECEAAGVHLNSRRLMALSTRPLDAKCWIAVSCHNAEELQQAARINADFAVLGPVRSTSSHPATLPLGWKEFATLVKHGGLPVYALGGMRPQDVTSARAAGAYGVAAISAIWQSDDLEGVIRDFLV